jgi:YHS domain-containing protein
MKKSIAVITVVFVLTTSGLVMAQMNGQSKGMMLGDGMMKDDANTPVAIEGYCPVCLLSGMKMKGSDHFVIEYKGKIYKFSSIEMQKAFLDNPEENTKDLDAKFVALSK